MGWNTPDIYYSPDHFGLEILGSIEWHDYAYEFDMTVVLRGEDGQLYYADDSGCSCPSPFEDFTSLDKATKCTVPELMEHLAERHRDARAAVSMDVANILARVV